MKRKLSKEFDAKEYGDKLYAALVEKAESLGGSKEKIDERIAEKIKLLGGFITRPGAIGLIAKEEGVQISMDTEPTSAPTELVIAKIAELPKHEGEHINLRGTVVFKSDFEMVQTKRGTEVPRMGIRVEDATGAVWINLWDKQATDAKEWTVPYPVLIEQIKVDTYKDNIQLKPWRGRTHFHKM